MRALFPLSSPSRLRPALSGLTVALVLVLAACSEPAPPPTGDPLQAYGPYLSALRAGEIQTALDSSWLPRKARTRTEAEARLKTTADLLADGTLRIDAVEARTEGNWALVVLRVTQRTPAGEARALREDLMLGVDGRWRVVARSLLSDAGLADRRDASLNSLLEWFRFSDEELSGRWLDAPESTQSP